MYSAMQSDRNNFCGDVVPDSFKKTSRDEDNILDQINRRNTKMHTNTTVALKPDFMRSLLLYVPYFFIRYIFFKHSEI